MILVTGGSGLVGSHLLYKLLITNQSVRAIYRREHRLENVKHVFSYYSKDYQAIFNRIEWFQADINDIPNLEQAFRGVDYVYHCAAFVSFEPDKYRLLRKINIEGTANIVNLCIAHGITKLCYVSSTAALGTPSTPNEFIDESNKWNPEADNSVYSITKYGAEIEVWRGSQENLDVVIVNPGVIIGPGYWKSGGSGSLIRRIYKEIPYYTTGSTGYVDVGDVTSIMIKLMESEISNERFILVAENLTYKEFIQNTAGYLNVTAPKKEANSLMLALAWRLDWLKHKILGRRRKISKQLSKSLQSKTRFSNEKIKNELGYEFIPMDQSLNETSQLFLQDMSR